MAAEPSRDPTRAQEEENDEGEESDVYEIEGEEEGDIYGPDTYEPEEDEDNEGDEGAGQVEPENMTALLLGKQNQNGTTRTEDNEEDEDDDDDDDDDDEYREDEEAAKTVSSAVAGSKRGVDELSEGDASSDEDENDVEFESKNITKKARV